MPIPAQSLLEASEPLDKRILSFLGAHADQAFTETEVMAGVEGHELKSLEIAMIFWDKARRAKVLIPYRVALKSLLLGRLVHSGIKSGVRYWMLAPRQVQK
jgi:hypothetical protein